MDCRDALERIRRWEGEGEVDEPLELIGHIEGCRECSASFSGLLPLLRRDAGMMAASRGPEASALAAAVLSRIELEGLEPESRRGASRRPRALLAGMAALLALGLGLGLILASRRGDTVTVRFVLLAPEARSVGLAGDFNGWSTEGYELRRGDSGTWTLEVRLPRGGYYSYNFVVDGERWIADPSSPERVDDGFGGSSSLLRI